MPPETLTPGAGIQPITNSRHSPEVVDSALLAYAMTGNAKAASEQLGAEGIRVPRRTILDWARDKHAARFAELQQKHAQEIEGVVIGNARRAALRASEVGMAALELEAERIAAGDVRDAAASSRNAFVGFGIALDKLLVMTNRPTSITEHHTGEEALRNLASRGRIIESDAVEIENEEEVIRG